MESIWILSGVHQESIRSLPGVHTLYQESIRSLPGVHQEYQDFIRTPDGVHQDAWGSVTYSMHVPPTMGGGGQYPQAGYAGPAPILPQPVSGDIFGVGLGGPARYTTPYMSMQNAHAGPSHLQPPQRDLHGTGLNHPMPPMAPPQYPPPHSDFIDLGDDAPQRQMHSAGNAPGPQPEIHPHHRTLRPVRSDPALNSGHMAHREREASHCQSLCDHEFVSLY